METYKTIRSKALILFSAIMVHIYGLITAIAACMYIWQLLLAEVLSPITRTPIEKVEALDTNLPLNRETIALKVLDMSGDEDSWEK